MKRRLLTIITIAAFFLLCYGISKAAHAQDTQIAATDDPNTFQETTVKTISIDDINKQNQLLQMQIDVYNKKITDLQAQIDANNGTVKTAQQAYADKVSAVSAQPVSSSTLDTQGTVSASTFN